MYTIMYITRSRYHTPKKDERSWQRTLTTMPKA